MEGLQITRLHESWTCVADVSDIELLSPATRSGGDIEFEVIVVGVGVEVIKISIDDEGLVALIPENTARTCIQTTGGPIDRTMENAGPCLRIIHRRTFLGISSILTYCSIPLHE